MMPLANWNGEILPLDEVKVSALDRGFLFGDAVYEAMRIYRGKIFLFDRHWERLARSLAELSIRADLDRLRGRLAETYSARPVSEGLVYVQITRGADKKRSHAFPPPEVKPSELLWIDSYPTGDPYAAVRPTGVDVITHPDLRWGRRDIKSVNLLGNCLAAQSAKVAGAAEALLTDSEGNLTEGSHTSLFGVQDGVIWTSPIGPHILPGITRGFVLELARSEGLPIQEVPIRVDELDRFSELFLTGTSTEVLGVRRVDGVDVGTGSVGPVTRQLAEVYRRAVDVSLKEIIAT